MPTSDARQAAEKEGATHFDIYGNCAMRVSNVRSLQIRRACMKRAAVVMRKVDNISAQRSSCLRQPSMPAPTSEVLKLRQVAAFLAQVDPHALLQQQPPPSTAAILTPLNGASVTSDAPPLQFLRRLIGAARTPSVHPATPPYAHAPPFNRCAVVGSAHHMLIGKGLGRCIDEHDLIMRFNHNGGGSATLPADPAEQQRRLHFGLRTTWRISTFPTWVHTVRREQQQSTISSTTSSSRRARPNAQTALYANQTTPEQILYCNSYWVGACRFTPKGSIALSPLFITAVQRLMSDVLRANGWSRQRRRDAHLKTPSSGMVGVALALASCRHVNLFGFTLDENLLKPSPPAQQTRNTEGGLDGSGGGGGGGGDNASCGADCEAVRGYFARGAYHHPWQLQMPTLRALAAQKQVHVVDGHFVARRLTDSQVDSGGHRRRFKRTQGLRYYLVPTNTTMSFAATPLTRGRRSFTLDGTPIDDVHWSAWKHVIVRALAVHPSRTLQRADASVCIVASPPAGGCEQWEALCPATKPLVVIDTVDADFVGMSGLRCETLWRSACKPSVSSGTRYELLRVVGGPPVHGKRSNLLRRCAHVSVPWLSHATSARLAQATRERPTRIAYAAGVVGHSMARVLGYEAWRKELQSACLRARSTMGDCKFQPQSIAGGLSHRAIALYARSVFCLMPPGDTLPRQGIVDAITVGCIPVFLHKGQRELWPWHWNASHASVLFDWGDNLNMRPRNATAAIESLLAFPATELQALQREIARVAPAFIYHHHRHRSEPLEHEAQAAAVATDDSPSVPRIRVAAPAAPDAIETFLAALAARQGRQAARTTGRGTR